MTNQVNEKKVDEEEDERSPLTLERHRKRLSIMRLANEFAQKDNPVKAVEGYLSYLNILANYYEVEESKLTPALFNVEKEMAELLLISQVYWNLAKIYDRNPRLQIESKRCLSQFIKFSTGFKFQYINAQMLKKFIRKKVAYNPKHFEDALNMIKVDSKKCFVATYAFGENHQITNDFRAWRDQISNNPFGKLFVNSYYLLSPPVVSFLEKNAFIGRFLKYVLIRPVLTIFSKIIRKD